MSGNNKYNFTTFTVETSSNISVVFLSNATSFGKKSQCKLMILKYILEFFPFNSGTKFSLSTCTNWGLL